jgi:hypothetical protein
MNIGAVVGIVLGVVVFGALAIYLGTMFVHRRSRGDRHGVIAPTD